MAELFVSAVLDVLFQKLRSDELINFSTQEGASSKLEKLAKALKMITPVLMDAEEKQRTNRRVEIWLEELQDLAYDAEDILDEYATEALRRKLNIEEHQANSTGWARKLIPSRFVAFTSTASTASTALNFNFSMHSKIDDITSRLENLCKIRDDLGLVEIARERSTASWNRSPTLSLQTGFSIYGRYEDKAKILAMVLADEPGVSVISIVGMGGIGKTAVAQLVYNDKEVLGFDLRAWVCISDDFDVLRISKNILKSITGLSCDHLKDLDVIQNLLGQIVSNKKLLFVFDDVWSTNYSHWESFRIPLLVAAQGSKIILTTRIEKVALTMGSYNKCYQLQILSDEDCWSLFKRNAIAEEVMGADHLIRQKVIEKCKGLPLIANALGGLLRHKHRSDWLFILDTKMWVLMDEFGILSALQLSYYYLPSHLKRCVAYCAILPKDYEFEENELVHLWMAEGLIQQLASDQHLEDLGCEYFHELLSRSFFQISSSNSSKFTMHSLINDLAQFVSRKISFRLEDELGSDKQSNKIEKTRYSSYTCDRYNVKSKFEVFKNAKHLRSFLPMLPTKDQFKTDHISNPIVFELLSQFKKLRVLSLQKYNIIGLLDSIGGLRHLRYLNLSDSNIRNLPESMNLLCNLQTLLLRNCRKLQKLPYDMGNLINLRHLDISCASLIVDMPMGIKKWEHLRTLSNFIVGKDSRLNELEHLKFLCGELHISRLENMIGFEDTMKFILSDKKDLKVLLLEWRFESDDLRHKEKVDNKVLAKLRPHENIEKLTIKGYGGTSFSWVGDISFSNITDLKLENCNRCTHLPSLGMLGSLRSLIIKGMKRIKSIGSEFYGHHCLNSLPSLETLCFEDLEEWEHWDNNKENECVIILPSLRNLSVVRCPKLSQRLPNNLFLLEKLVIRECAQLVENSIEKSTQWLHRFNFLKELHIGNCKTLTTLIGVIEQNNNYLEELRIEDCHDPTFVFRSHPPASLKRLDVRNCEKLQCLCDTSSSSSSSMIKQDNGNISTSHLEDLYVQDCPSLTCVLSIHQLSATLVHLCIKKCSKLTNLSLPSVVKYLEIEECSELTTLLPRDQLPGKLGSLKISRCPKLESIAERFHNNNALYKIWIEGCEKLKSIPDGLHTLSSLSDIRISYCENLVSFPEGGFPDTDTYLSVEIKACSKLTNLSLPRTQLPEKLASLKISWCPKLESIAERFHNNNALYKIWIEGCEKLKSIPDGLHTLKSLSDICISYCENIVSFPEGGFPDSNTNLSVEIKACSQLKNLSLPTVLQYLEIEECSELTALLPRDKLPEKLASLKISWCPKLESIADRFHNNSALYEIWIAGCEKLKSIPDGLHTLSSLSDIRISYCANLVSFPEGGFPDTNLRVEIKACEKLKALPQVHTLTSLQQLSLWDCPSLSFPAQGLPTNLESLAIQGHKLYEKLEEVGLQNITSLGNLSICGLPDILSFRVEEIRISLPPNLTHLYIGHFSNLKDLSSMGLEKLTYLQWLSVHNCPHLKSLPSLPSSLLEKHIKECPLLEEKK